MESITKYKVQKEGLTTIITGDFDASGGVFKIIYQGDGGNADTYIIKLTGGQYDDITFTITGAWEIREVIEMFKLLGKTI